MVNTPRAKGKYEVSVFRCVYHTNKFITPANNKQHVRLLARSLTDSNCSQKKLSAALFFSNGHDKINKQNKQHCHSNETTKRITRR